MPPPPPFTSIDTLIYKIDNRLEVLKDKCVTSERKKEELAKLIFDAEKALIAARADPVKRERIARILEGAREELLKTRIMLRENNCPQSKESIKMEIENLAKRRRNIGMMNKFFNEAGKPLGVPPVRSISKSGSRRKRRRTSFFKKKNPTLTQFLKSYDNGEGIPVRTQTFTVKWETPRYKYSPRRRPPREAVRKQVLVLNRMLNRPLNPITFRKWVKMIKEVGFVVRRNRY